jgi:hypothetical protein
MNSAAFIQMAHNTLRDPRASAVQIISMALPRDVLWTALALVAALNTFLILLLIDITGSVMVLPSYFDAPLALFVLLTGLMVVYIHAMYWTGLAIGGQGALMDVLALVVWFQVLRAVAQLAVIVLTLAIPGLGTLLSLVVAIWGLWIFLNFIAAAMNLPSVGHGLLVLVLSAVGLVLGLAVLLSIIGLSAQGVT